MRQGSYWAVLFGGLFMLTSSACTVKQQQEVLAGVGTLIPGSKNSLNLPREADLHRRLKGMEQLPRHKHL